MVFDEKWTDTQANLNLWVIFFTKVHDDSQWNFNEAFFYVFPLLFLIFYVDFKGWLMKNWRRQNDGEVKKENEKIPWVINNDKISGLISSLHQNYSIYSKNFHVEKFLLNFFTEIFSAIFLLINAKSPPVLQLWCFRCVTTCS